MKYSNFYEEVPAGVQEPTPPAAPAAPASTTPPASEGVKTPDGNNQQFVPYERFAEVNTKAKEASDRAQRVETELKAIRDNPGSLFGTAPKTEPELDPDVSATLDGYMQSKGYLTKAELLAERQKEQAQTDLQSLKTEHNLSDEDLGKVRQAAADAGATNKKGLEYAYQALFQDKIVEDKVKEALAKQHSPASGERPGPSGVKAPTGTDKGKLTMVDRIKAAAAKQAR